MKRKDWEQVLRRLRNGCLHCQRRPKILPRPLKLTDLGQQPREVLLSDFLYVNVHGYLLTILDSLSRKIFLKFCKIPNVDIVVQGLMEFRAHYNLSDEFLLITDNGSYYASQVFQELRERLRFRHKFSVAYCPWTNGATESINSPILKHLKVLCSEYSLHEREWPELIPLVMYIINNQPMDSRGGQTPNQIFMGSDPPKDFCHKNSLAVLIDRELTEIQSPEQIKTQVGKIKEVILQSASKAYSYALKRRVQENKRRNRKRWTWLPQFNVGDSAV